MYQAFAALSQRNLVYDFFRFPSLSNEMSGTLLFRRVSCWRLNPFFLFNLLSFLFVGSTLVRGETYTNSECNNALSTMGSCASQWDSIRIACKSAVTTNTVWPGPCECGYFANDLPCFDDQALCAAQVWYVLSDESFRSK
jgi:hypothetical protein